MLFSYLLIKKTLGHLLPVSLFDTSLAPIFCYPNIVLITETRLTNFIWLNTYTQFKD